MNTNSNILYARVGSLDKTRQVESWVINQVDDEEDFTWMKAWIRRFLFYMLCQFLWTSRRAQFPDLDFGFHAEHSFLLIVSLVTPSSVNNAADRFHMVVSVTVQENTALKKTSLDDQLRSWWACIRTLQRKLHQNPCLRHLENPCLLPSSAAEIKGIIVSRIVLRSSAMRMSLAWTLFPLD